MVDDDIWQDIQPGDLITTPFGGQGLVIAVLPGAHPAPQNATVLVLGTGGRIEQFTKVVLADDPVLERPPPQRARDLVSALGSVPSNPDPHDVVATFASVERPISEEGWTRLSRRIEFLATYGR